MKKIFNNVTQINCKFALNCLYGISPLEILFVCFISHKVYSITDLEFQLKEQQTET